MEEYITRHTFLAISIRLLLGLIIIFHASVLYAQRDAPKHYKSIQARLHYGFIFAHSEAVQNTAGAHPRGVDIELAKQRVDTTSWDLCHCYPAKGWGVSYFNYDNRVLGHSITLAYFLEPAYRLNSRSQFRFRGSAGLSCLTNPYNKEANPTNMSYSSHLGGFLRLGLSATYVVAPRWIVQLGAQYQHISNGGLKEPNKGINWPTASLGIIHTKTKYQVPFYRHRNKTGNVLRKPYLEAGLFFSAKQGHTPDGGTPRTPLTGLVVHGEKQVGRTSALNTGIELYYDNALNQKLKNDSIDGSAYRAGILAGHTFLLGRFYFSQQLGVYAYKNNPYYDRIYHRWTLRYQFSTNWLVGLSLNAHRHVADFFDVRIMYRL